MPRKKSPELDSDQGLSSWSKLEGESLTTWLWKSLAEVLQTATSTHEKTSRSWPRVRKPKDPRATLKRIKKVIKRDRATLARPTEAGAEVMETELLWVVYTVALAILNPIRTSIDATNFAERVKKRSDISNNEDDHLAKFYRRVDVGDVNEPAVILDAWGRILAWHLPNVISTGRVEEANIATEQIGDLLNASYKEASFKAQKGKTINWRSDPKLYNAPDTPRFAPGSVDFSPGWFAQAHERLLDTIVPSSDLRKTAALPWLTCMSHSTVLLNAITALTHKKLYLAAHKAIARLKCGKSPHLKAMKHENVQSWSSVFSGISVIANRITPEHRDTGGSIPWYDLLLSSGTHRRAYFHLNDIRARLSYSPGTVVMVCGKILRHSLPEWSHGERICLAHFMRQEVLHRLGVYSPDWCWQGSYTRIMNRTFTAEQRWTQKRDYVDGGDLDSDVRLER